MVPQRLWGSGWGTSAETANYYALKVCNDNGGASQARTTAPGAATRNRKLVPPDDDPAGIIESALGELREQASLPGVHSIVLAIDTRHWELVQFTLWEHESAGSAETHYQVLHVSTHLGEIRLGRHW